MLKLSRTEGKRFSVRFLSLLLISGQVLPLLANPTGGQVVSGSANINTVPGTVTINQGTTSAIINWQSFSINSGELTKFLVPNSSSSTLNRVLGGNASAIYGTLESNGQVFLLNPNGILVGPSGQIDTAGFVGSTLSLTDTQFNQGGDLNFLGTSKSGISNQGTIHASGGDVYLIASQVNNSGTITAPKGTVGLAAGTQVLLQKAGDQHLFVQVGNGATGQQATGVTNTGAITSAAAELRASGGNAYALAINNSGNIVATGVTKVNGQVYLTAAGGNITNSGKITAKQANGNGGTVVINAHGTAGSTVQGTVEDTGTITASGTASGATGGTVNVLGDRVAVTDNAVIDVSGDADGGTALIGGDEHGSNPAIPDASQTFLGSKATITADALTFGNGGKVVLWGNDTTQFYGHISVRGGAQGGNGGFVETSGYYLDAQSVPDLAAPKGLGGTWLLDPYDVDIVATGLSNTTSGSDGNGGTQFSSNNPSGASTLVVGDIATALASGSVEVYATGSSDSNITWQPGANLNYGAIGNGTFNLTLQATGVLELNGISITNGMNTSASLNLNFFQADSGGLRIINSTIALNGGSLFATSSINSNNVGTDFASAPSDAGIYITGSTLTTGGAGTMDLFGTGVVSSGMNAIGIEIENSTIAIGLASSPSTSSSNIDGNSDNGFTFNSPDAMGADNSYGVVVGGGSTISYYSTASSSGDLEITGHSYANNDANAAGLAVNNSTVQVTNGHVSLKGRVNGEQLQDSENPSISQQGVAEDITGVILDGAQVTASGLNTNLSQVTIDGKVNNDTVATDGGDTSVSPYSIGVDIINNSQVTASLDTQALSVAIGITGEGGQVETSLGNINSAIAAGVTILGNSNAGTSTITNSGLGATAIAGIGGTATAQDAIGVGVDILGGAGTNQKVIDTTGGGSIGIAGLGGVVSPDSDASTFTGRAVGVAIGSFNYVQSNTAITSAPAVVETTSGSIFVIAAAGSLNAESLPGTSTVNLVGLDLHSATLETGVSGGTSIPGGGTVPPTILIYATTSTIPSHTGSATIQVGSPSDFAVNEDVNSALISPNLVMGNYYNYLATYAPASFVSQLSTISGSLSTFLNSNGATLNPAGIISLESPLNQIGRLDSALVGSGGFDLFDSTSLVVDPIGGTDNANFGEIDQPATAPVVIATSGDLTLTDGGFTSVPVISTTGTGNDIILVADGKFINQDNDPVQALSASGGARYIVYTNSDPSTDNVGNLTGFTSVFSTSFTGIGTPPDVSGNLIVFSGATGTIGSGNNIGNPDNPGNPQNQVQNALVNLPPITPPGGSGITGSEGNTVTKGSDVVGGASGVGGGKHGKNGGNKTEELYSKLVQIYGRGAVQHLLDIINKDIKDGSPVNTGTLIDKWAANTGFSKLVFPGEYSELNQGTAQPGADDTLYNEFQTVFNQGSLDALSSVVFGHDGAGQGGH